MGGIMLILDTELKDVKILTLDKREDIRGCVEVTINNEEMAKQGIHFVCQEQRIYHISKKGTFYGIHFQTKRYPQKKIIHLLAGRGIDYIIDLHKDSPTYKKWISIELQGNDDQHIYIPQGYGHAFLSLEDNTTQIFTVSEHFYKNESMKIRFDDQQINLSIPIEIGVMSNQDRNAPYLADIDFEV